MGPQQPKCGYSPCSRCTKWPHRIVLLPFGTPINNTLMAMCQKSILQVVATQVRQLLVRCVDNED